MIYEWKAGARHSVPAQTAGDIVADLAEANGGICPPSAVVDAARLPSSPLHKVIFRLDRNQAAEAWYRQEARQLVNDITVVLEGTTSRPAAFLSVQLIGPDGPRIGYAPRRIVMESDELHAQALHEALAALNGFRRRYRHLSELRDVFEAVDRLGVAV